MIVVVEEEQDDELVLIAVPRFTYTRRRVVLLGLVLCSIGLGYLFYDESLTIWQPQLVASGFVLAGLLTFWFVLRPKSRLRFSIASAFGNVAFAGRVGSIIVGLILQPDRYGINDVLSVAVVQVGIMTLVGYGVWRFWQTEVRAWVEFLRREG